MTSRASRAARAARPAVVRRIVTPLVVAGAAGLIVLGFQATRDERRASCHGGPILVLYPCPGDTDLRQGRIGASVVSGYTAELQVDGVDIPDDQLSAAKTAGDYVFVPGAGTATGSLAPGRHSATIIYWPAGSDREHGNRFSWSFSVH